MKRHILHIALIMIMLPALAACGDGGGGGGGTPGNRHGVRFTCANVSSDSLPLCESLIVNAGAISNASEITAISKARSLDSNSIKVYPTVSVLYNGCSSQGIIISTVTLMQPGGTYWLDAYLTPSRYGPAFCSDYGPASAIFTLYDGSAYPLDTIGDPTIDPILDTVTVHFELVP